MNVKLSSEEFFLLKSMFKNIFIKEEQVGSQYFIKISKEDASSIRDACGDLLQQSGFDEEYSLNNQGRILESLIDKFYM